MTNEKRVKKKDGGLETFNPDKVKKAMLKAAIDSGYTLEGNEDLTLVDVVTKDINKVLEEDDVIKTSTIRNIILNKLGKLESSIAASWRKFENKYKS